MHALTDARQAAAMRLALAAETLAFDPDRVSAKDVDDLAVAFARLALAIVHERDSLQPAAYAVPEHRHVA